MTVQVPDGVKLRLLFAPFEHFSVHSYGQCSFGPVQRTAEGVHYRQARGDKEADGGAGRKLVRGCGEITRLGEGAGGQREGVAWVPVLQSDGQVAFLDKSVDTASLQDHFPVFHSRGPSQHHCQLFRPLYK